MRIFLVFIALSLSVQAWAQLPARPYLGDTNTELLYHFNERAGTAAADSSGNNRSANYGSVQIGNTGLAFFDSAISAGAGLANRVYWKDTGAGVSSFLFPRAGAAFTIEGWFKLNDTAFTHRAALFTVQPDGNAALDYQLWIAPANDATRPLGLVFSDSTHYRVYTAGLSWNTNTWYHIAVVVNQGASGTTYTLYRTALSAATTGVCAVSVAGVCDVVAMSGALMDPIPEATNAADRVLSIGNFYGNWGDEFFPGQIDEVRFSSIARTADDFRLSVAPTVADRIRTETVAANSETDHALPLVGIWNSGTTAYDNPAGKGDVAYWGYTPTWQLEQIAAGHFILPTFISPTPDLVYASGTRYESFYKTPLESAAAQKLPIALVAGWGSAPINPGGQWESLLYLDPAYFGLAAADNPNVISLSDGGSVAKMLSPFGAEAPWTSVGESWGGSQAMTALQTLYPDPPRVLYVSNNEADREKWGQATNDQHYYDAGHSAADSDDLKIKSTGKGWCRRYRLMQDAWRGALTSASWRSNSRFAGYQAFGRQAYGRWGEWREYSLSYDLGGTDHRIDMFSLGWDGGSPDYYLKDTGPDVVAVGDAKVMSVQIESMNQEFMRREALELNPEFWFELSVSLGCDAIDANNHPTCANITADYTPARYAGVVQFGMWLLRPRLVRDFHKSEYPRAQTQAYFNAVMDAVDRVHNDPVLQSFWRNSAPVSTETATYRHPYQQNTLASYSSAQRMFLLQASVNPPPPTSSWTLTTQIKVFALARVQGAAGSRRWLVYASAPEDAQSGVTLTVPDFGNITVDVSVAGSFYLLDEATHTYATL